MYKTLYLLSVVLIATCNASDKKQQTSAQDTAKANHAVIVDQDPPLQNNDDKQAVTSIEVGDSTLIMGDFDGDHIPDSGYFVVVDKYITEFDPKDYEHGGDNHIDSVVYGYKFCFPGEKIATLPGLGGAVVSLVNEGDVNRDGKDEISVLQQHLLTGTCAFNTYTYQNGQWKQILGKQFAGYYGLIEEVEVQGRIVMEDSILYYYEHGDSPGEKLELIPD
jgi:hypothetical protein